jgi:recombination protein RecA
VARKKAPAITVDELIEAYQRRYGQYALDYAVALEPAYQHGKIATGLDRLDALLGGGIPRGVMTELYGTPGGGKTWLCLRTIAACQQAGGRAAYVDIERTYAPGFAAFCGVRTQDLLLSSPSSGEEALEIAVDLVRYGLDLVVLDSVAALVSSEVLEKQVELGGYAPGVRLLNVGLAKLRAVLGPGRPSAVILVNQVRENLGVLYGPRTTTPMGWRLKHDSALILEMRRVEWMKRQDRRVGQVSSVRIEKTKIDGTAPAGAEASLDIVFPEAAS